MCGIVGVMDLHGSRAISRSLIARLNETQVHRGPDEGSLHLEPGLGFGHRRLGLADLQHGEPGQPLPGVVALVAQQGHLTVHLRGPVATAPRSVESVRRTGRSHEAGSFAKPVFLLPGDKGGTLMKAPYVILRPPACRTKPPGPCRPGG
jgi:hypothetical protein